MLKFNSMDIDLLIKTIPLPKKCGGFFNKDVNIIESLILEKFLEEDVSDHCFRFIYFVHDDKQYNPAIFEMIASTMNYCIDYEIKSSDIYVNEESKAFNKVKTPLVFCQNYQNACKGVWISFVMKLFKEINLVSITTNDEFLVFIVSLCENFIDENFNCKDLNTTDINDLYNSTKRDIEKYAIIYDYLWKVELSQNKTKYLIQNLCQSTKL